MLLNSGEFKFLKNYRNVYVKSSAKREYRDENVFLKGDRALSKIITTTIISLNGYSSIYVYNRKYILHIKVFHVSCM